MSPFWKGVLAGFLLPYLLLFVFYIGFNLGRQYEINYLTRALDTPVELR